MIPEIYFFMLSFWEKQKKFVDDWNVKIETLGAIE
jgi:hypothetical protein